jgi:addiction module HigA family antidote
MSITFDLPYPAEILRDTLFPGLGLSVTQAALQLRVTSTEVLHILDGREGISPQTALKIENRLGDEYGGEADLWVARQAAYDLCWARNLAIPCFERESLNNELVFARLPKFLDQCAVRHILGCGH